MIDLLLCSAQLDQLNLAVDRKLDAIFDLDDATKVQTWENRIMANSGGDRQKTNQG